MDFNSTQMYMFHALDKIDKFDNARIGSAVKKALAWDKAGIVVVKPNENGLKGDTRSKLKFQAKTDQAIVNAAVDPAEAKRPLKNVGDAATPTNPALGSAAANFLHRVGDMDPNGGNSDVFSRTGIEIRCGSSDDATTCGTHGVNIYLDVMVKGLERLLVAGEYTQEQIERWQKRTKEDWKLHSTQEENEYVRQVMTAIYGPDHPYTQTAILPPDAANKIHMDSLVDYRDKHFRAGNATLILVGSFDPKAAEKLVRSVFGDMGKGTVDKPVDPKPYKRNGPVFVGVKKSKEDQQVTVTIAYPAPAGVDGQEGARRVLSEMMNTRAENVRPLLRAPGEGRSELVHDARRRGDRRNDGCRARGRIDQGDPRWAR